MYNIEEENFKKAVIAARIRADRRFSTFVGKDKARFLMIREALVPMVVEACNEYDSGRVEDVYGEVVASLLTSEALKENQDLVKPTGPVPEWNDAKWDTLEPIETEGPGSPHPTTHQDIADAAVYEDDARKRYDALETAVLQHQDADKKNEVMPETNNNLWGRKGDGESAVTSTTETSITSTTKTSWENPDEVNFHDRHHDQTGQLGPEPEYGADFWKAPEGVCPECEDQLDHVGHCHTCGYSAHDQAPGGFPDDPTTGQDSHWAKTRRPTDAEIIARYREGR